MRYFSILLASGIIGLAACNNSTPTSDTPTTDSAKPANPASRPRVESKLGEAGTGQLMDVVAKYFALKNALVATKGTDADSAASRLATATGAFRTEIQNDSVNKSSITPYLDTIINQSKSIASTQDKTCSKQRTAFSTLSSAIYGLAKKAELKKARIYQQHCPMAIGGIGASWLSDDTDIKNPYFGDKMMECGEVTDSLQ